MLDHLRCVGHKRAALLDRFFLDRGHGLGGPAGLDRTWLCPLFGAFALSGVRKLEESRRHDRLFNHRLGFRRRLIDRLRRRLDIVSGDHVLGLGDDLVIGDHRGFRLGERPADLGHADHSTVGRLFKDITGLTVEIDDDSRHGLGHGSILRHPNLPNGAGSYRVDAAIEPLDHALKIDHQAIGIGKREGRP